MPNDVVKEIKEQLKKDKELCDKVVQVVRAALIAMNVLVAIYVCL